MDWHIEKDPLAQLICELFGCEKIRCVMNEEQEKRTRKIFIKKFRTYLKKHNFILIGKFYLGKREVIPFVEKANIYKVGKVYKLLKKQMGGYNG